MDQLAVTEEEAIRVGSLLPAPTRAERERIRAEEEQHRAALIASVSEPTLTAH